MSRFPAKKDKDKGYGRRNKKWRIPQEDYVKFVELVEPELREALNALQYPSDVDPMTYERIYDKVTGNIKEGSPLISYFNTGVYNKDFDSETIGGYYNSGEYIYGRPQYTTPDTAYIRPPYFLDKEMAETWNTDMGLAPFLQDWMYDQPQETKDWWEEKFKEGRKVTDGDNFRKTVLEALFHETLHSDEKIHHEQPQKYKVKPYGWEFHSPDAKGKYVDHPKKKRDQAFFRDAIENTGVMNKLYEYDDKGKKIAGPNYTRTQDAEGNITSEFPDFKLSPLGKHIDSIIDKYYNHLLDEREPFIGPPVDRSNMP
tara:strand:- start:458 stop:1396 length:939 start_codon:yes stop_codon:yes gene_type:complete